MSAVVTDRMVEAACEVGANSLHYWHWFAGQYPDMADRQRAKMRAALEKAANPAPAPAQGEG